MPDARAQRPAAQGLAAVASLRRREFGFGIFLIGVYALLRTADVVEPLLVAWAAVAVLGAVLSPVVGLTVLAGISPFTGALEDDGRVTSVPFLLAAVGAGLLLRIVPSLVTRRTGWRITRTDVAVVLAVVVMAGTALGVANSWLTYGPALGRQALELWVPGIGGAMTVLLASTWAARAGETRPVYVLAASITLAAAVALVEFFRHGAVNASAFGWLVHDQVDSSRLTGIILAPNAAATIFLVGVSLSYTMALFEPHRRARVAASAAGAVTLVAALLTYSRSALIALALIALILGWRWRRMTGVALVGLAGVVTIVGYALLTDGSVVRTVPAFADQQRLDAWGAAFRMWLEHPFTGAGFRSFEWRHTEFGSLTLDAPHNEWLRFFAEGGTLVGAAALAFAFAALISLVRARHWLTAAAAACAVGLFVMACFNNLFLYAQVNVPAFMMIGTGLALAANQLRTRRLAFGAIGLESGAPSPGFDSRCYSPHGEV